jgi:hypothetical protein
MRRMIGWKFERISRDSLLKAEQGTMTHSQWQEAEAEPQPP